jgi:ubiquinone/menaquinone biosynthesis C-methylase UbiE
MNNLYTQLSEVYEAMYLTFINYEEELNFYSSLLKKYHCGSVLEIGCGTGNLAPGFVRQGFEYCGMDISSEMLKIAKRNHPQSRFIEADMRNFELDEKLAASIITGRTISYLVTNKNVFDAFTSINKNLPAQGILCFDCIDANKFIPLIKNGERITHNAEFETRKFHRESYWQIDLAQSWTFTWSSVYYEEKENHLEKIGEDKSAIRAFCKDEIKLFLELTGFRLKEIVSRPSYAFDTFVVVAEKI